MKTLNDFLLMEIGDSRKPYAYKIKFGRQVKNGKMVPDKIRATFRAVAGDFRVFFWEQRHLAGHSFEVGFEGPDGEKLTDAGIASAFRIIATMIAIIKDVIKQFPAHYDGAEVSQISFKSSEHGKSGFNDSKASKQRLKLYNAFVKHELRGTNTKVNIGFAKTTITIK